VRIRDSGYGASVFRVVFAHFATHKYNWLPHTTSLLLFCLPFCLKDECRRGVQYPPARILGSVNRRNIFISIHSVE